jgi:septum formation protein
VPGISSSSDGYLARRSASPRRSELLRQIGVPHCVRSVDLDETALPGEAPADYVLRLAAAKALAVQAARIAARAQSLPVLGADTTVTIDGAVLGKPQDTTELVAMFAQLGGREHEVLSAVAVATRDADGAPQVRTRLSRTRVRFRAIAPGEAETYWATGEPRDKAGGYGIQGLGAVFVESIEGSYSGVVGLPLAETAALLREAGVPMWQGAA